MLKIKKSIFFITPFLLLAGVFVFTSQVYAAGLVPCGSKTSPCTICHLILGVKGLVDWGLTILITISLLAITIAGVMYVVSSGSEQMMTSSKNFLSASLTGFAIALAAWLIVNTTMLIISTQTELGIGRKWTTFSCDTSSNALVGAGTSEDTATTDTGSTSADEAVQTACRKYYNEYYGNKTGDDYDKAMASCDKVTANDYTENTTQALQAACKKYYNDYYGNDTSNSKYKTDLASCDNLSSSNANGISADSIAAAAQRAKAFGCKYSQDLRNDCKGNPAYTDCGQLACDSMKSSGYDTSSFGSCKSVNTSTLYSKAETVGDKNLLKAGDILVRPKTGTNGGHAVICEQDGCSTVTHAAGKDKGIVTGQKEYMLKDSSVKVIRVAKYKS